LLEATGENTKTGALFCAVEHYLEDLRNKRALVEELDPETAERLSTSELPIEVSIERSVGTDVDR
jgi:hypothetical protein